ncbi:hypothetical protein Tco_0032538 [Tanacetum coccineum]
MAVRHDAVYPRDRQDPLNPRLAACAWSLQWTSGHSGVLRLMGCVGLSQDFAQHALDQKEFSQRGALGSQAIVTPTPTANRASTDGKKTLKKNGDVIKTTGANPSCLESREMAKEKYIVMHLDLSSFDSFRTMFCLKVPINTIVAIEGGSGGALAI